jgi:hypothetical protein
VNSISKVCALVVAAAYRPAAIAQSSPEVKHHKAQLQSDTAAMARDEKGMKADQAKVKAGAQEGKMAANEAKMKADDKKLNQSGLRSGAAMAATPGSRGQLGQTSQIRS